MTNLQRLLQLFAATLWDLRSRPSRRNVQDEVSWIEAPDLAERLEREPQPLVIDVRGADEFAGELGHLGGARNIPLSELPQKLDDLDRFKQGPVVLVCRTQMRSAQAAAMLKEAGFGDVAVLRGGMVEWARRKRSAEVEASANRRSAAFGRSAKAQDS